MLIISACRTVETNTVIYRYQLPPSPVREIIQLPENPTLADYAEVILYYDSLLQEWEIWGENVKILVEGEKILDNKSNNGI